MVHISKHEDNGDDLLIFSESFPLAKTLLELFCSFQHLHDKSLEDKTENWLKEHYGLVVSWDFAKKLIDDEDSLTIEIEIESSAVLVVACIKKARCNRVEMKRK